VGIVIIVTLTKLSRGPMTRLEPAARVWGLQNTLRGTDFVNSFTIPAISRLTTQRFS